MTPKEYYASCNLIDNPFRPSAIGVDDPRAGIWVGYDKQQAALERLLKRVRADQVGLTSFVLLYGTWGTGKSHALLWSRDWVKKTSSGVAYYLPTLKRDKGKLALNLALKEDVVESGQLPEDLHNYYAWLSKKILEVTVAHPGIQPDDAINRLFQIPDQRALAQSIYQTGGKTEQLAAFLVKHLGSDHEAVTLFSKIVNLLILEIGESDKERFTQAVYLFVDELDDLSRQPAKDSLQTNDTLRHLYDACPNAFGLIIGASAELNTLQHLFTEYVLSRMTRKIEFSFLDQNAAKTFIRDVLDLKSNRVDLGAAEKRGYFPLTEDAVAEIVSHLRQITPRDVVNTMQQVLEEMRLAEVDVGAGPMDSAVMDDNGILDFILDD
ncbi:MULTISPECIES: hypothetical protein [unclassified Xanthomonas]|uniref:hypothetical protein n=1 Tax=Xanthomonas sp. LMG 8992 TaxID=1591157 RepID=UPI001368F9A8|nr:hypothetical protein [Xanthomonas sp. LMG 8992]